MGKDDKNMSTVWIDLLCWKSALKAALFARRHQVARIYYANTTVVFQPLIAPFARILGKPVEQILTVVESEEKIDGVSLYEFIQKRTVSVIEGWVKKESVTRQNTAFCKRYGFNIAKYEAFIKECAFPHMFRPVGLMALAQQQALSRNAVFILRRTPFSGLLREIRGAAEVLFYDTFFLPRRNIVDRRDYYYDHVLNKQYYMGKFAFIGKSWMIWLLTSVFSVADAIVRGLKRKAEAKHFIGVELWQPKFREDDVNELFWLDGSGINPRTVAVIEVEDLDEASVENLRALEVSRYKVFDIPRKAIASMLRKQGGEDSCRFIFPGGGYGWRTLAAMIRSIVPLVFWHERGWLTFQETVFFCRTRFWQAVYQRLGIKILWTMVDADKDKLPKAQAIETLGGLYAGGHWSNNQLYLMYNQKCSDVLLTWGEHFLTNNYDRYPFLAIFQTGYPSDHYFMKRRARAMALRQQYPGKFIISYHDNFTSHDIYASDNMQRKIYSMLINILKRYSQTILFIKPKKKMFFDDFLKQFSELGYWIEQGRVMVFFGETPRTKAVPAEIGMASDLVLGLSVSTPASECFFAGTLAFHADLTGFINNRFANDGLDKVVFRDINSLQRAVEDRIVGRDALPAEAYRKYYECLDPFQDGQAYRRTGFIMRKLQESLTSGLDQHSTVQKVRADYDAYLQEQRSQGKLTLTGSIK